MKSLVLVLSLLVYIVHADVENPCEGLLSAVLIDPDSCYKFIICYKEEPEFMTCPDGTIFSVDEIDCVPGNQATCTEGFPEEPENDERLCRGIVLGRFPDPDSCTTYYSCIFGRQQKQSCREGYVFSTRSFLCLPGNPESCKVQLLPTTTTPAPESVKPIPVDYCLRNDKPFGRLPHPQFCTRYVDCLLWIPSEEFCSSWMVFNDRLNICLYGDPNTCRTIIGPGATTPDPNPPTTTLAPIPEDICPDKVIAVIPHPYSCTSFITCILGRPNVQQCPSYTVFSEKHSVCLPGDPSTCTVYWE
ncbi:protein obstructor-E-like [Wyeomyia smithii]|uniref:protein obstructor-E-like n=1 Tax=Wyeomyia smithii TaxID=174621 RepID=UPI0024681C70|nr:protein obstructor-E-like [Wyeomyia smithii]